MRGEAWHIKTKAWLNKGGGACTGKFNIPEARKPLKSGEPHEKRVPVWAGGPSERGWEARRHNYTSSCDRCETCQEPGRCCTELTAPSRQAAKCRVPRAAKGKQVNQQGACRSSRTGVVQNCISMKVMHWDESRERYSFVYKHARDNQVTVESNFISEFHTLLSQIMHLDFPLCKSTASRPGRAGASSLHFSLSAHMLRMRALMAAFQRAESSLVFP